MTGSAKPYDGAGAELGRSAGSRVSFRLAYLPQSHCDELGAAFAAMDPWASYPYPASALSKYFASVEPGAPRYALMAGDNMAGVVGLRINWLRGPYLQFLGVLPQHQGNGAGGLVLDWLEREARAAGDRNLWVCASDFNEAGIRFYDRHGFTRTAVLDGLVHNARDELLLRKRLFTA